MLVLSRKLYETICIGKDIQVQVVKIRGDQVRLGIEAPRELAITRPKAEELPRRPQRKRRAA